MRLEHHLVGGCVRYMSLYIIIIIIIIVDIRSKQMMNPVCCQDIIMNNILFTENFIRPISLQCVGIQQKWKSLRCHIPILQKQMCHSWSLR